MPQRSRVPSSHNRAQQHSFDTRRKQGAPGSTAAAQKQARSRSKEQVEPARHVIGRLRSAAPVASAREGPASNRPALPTHREAQQRRCRARQVRPFRAARHSCAFRTSVAPLALPAAPMSNAKASASLLAIEDFTWALEPLVRRALQPSPRFGGENPTFGCCQGVCFTRR